MIVRSLSDITGTERDVKAPTFASRRFVLAKEKVGFSLHETVLYAGTETRMWYANHIEAVYCIGGEGERVHEGTRGKNPPRAPATDPPQARERHTRPAPTRLSTGRVLHPPRRRT